jgi:hypothetical protein
MACPCKTKGKGERVQVKLAGGTTVTKSSLAEATKFAARHPGAKVIKAAKAA